MDKEELRQRIWKNLEENNQAAFPFPPQGRIPNFVGSSRAADHLTTLDIWKQAKTIKCNPDAPQRYVRIKALEEGKTIYMAVPRLKDKKCFVKIQVEPEDAKSAASISGAFDYGTPVHPNDMDPIDLVVTGSVVVNPRGDRIGKGEGYSDIELAILNHFNKISIDTPIVTTVHPIQILDRSLPQDSQDLKLDIVVAEDQIYYCDPNKPELGIDWNKLTQDKIDDIPILKSIQP